MSDQIERVGVIGAGQMGGGIAEVSARAGVDVLVYEPTEELTTAGKARISKSLERGVSTVFLSAGDESVARLYGRLGFARVGTACVAEPG